MKFGNAYFLGMLWIIPALIVFYIWAFKRKKILIERFVSAELKDRLLKNLSPGRQRFKAFLLILTCLFAILALNDDSLS